MNRARAKSGEHGNFRDARGARVDGWSGSAVVDRGD